MNDEQKAAIENRIRAIISDVPKDDHRWLAETLINIVSTLEYYRGYDDCYDDIKGDKV